jgi:6-phosphogluconolactonase (cycloisomerase 2 family)
MAEVATTAANGAAEANNVNYNLNYNTGTADPPILLQKLNLGRTIWPDTPHCSDINLGTGSFVYALAPTENSVIVPASINAQTGSLTVGTNATTPGSNTIALDPSSRYLYAVNSASISTFKIDQSTGNLTKFGGDVGAAFDSGGAAVDPSDSYLFVTSNSEHTVRTYKIAQPAGGALTLIDTTPLPAGNSPEAVTVDPSGRFLYTLNSSYPIGTSITAFQIANANAAKPGFLTNVGTTTLPQGFTGQAIEASQGGQYVYAAAAYGPVAGFSINQQSGTLTPLTALGSPWNAGKNPLGLETDPYGAYLYVGNQAISGFPTNTMEVFSIAEPSGGLTPLQSFDLQQFGLAVFDGFAVDRTGSFLYELQGYNSTEGAIDGYAISPTKGTLTNLGSTNISGGAFYAGGSTNQTVIAATGTIE